MRFCVAGATGHIGRPLVERLAAGGHEVVAVSRSGVRRPDLAGVTDVRVDLEAEVPTGLTAGCDGLFLLSGWSRQAELLAQAATAGVRRVVATSGVSAALDDDNPFTRLQRGTEDAVAASGLPAVLLRLHALASNTGRWAAQLVDDDLVREPFVDVESSVVHPEDAAAAAAAALTASAFPTGTYRLTGPEPLTARQRLAELGDVLDRELELEEVPVDELLASPSEWERAAVVLARLGDESTSTDDVRALTGREPRTHLDWCLANVHLFGP